MFLHCPCLHSAFDNAGPQLYTECVTSHHIYAGPQLYTVIYSYIQSVLLLIILIVIY